jgi:hypothetical protein
VLDPSKTIDVRTKQTTTVFGFCDSMPGISGWEALLKPEELTLLRRRNNP